jgi:hypothetical protein
MTITERRELLVHYGLDTKQRHGTMTKDVSKLIGKIGLLKAL